jgi:hypothetical protein
LSEPSLLFGLLDILTPGTWGDWWNLAEGKDKFWGYKFLKKRMTRREKEDDRGQVVVDVGEFFRDGFLDFGQELT